MSTDCENLLKKFLVLNPARRASLEAIMKDKWMNMGHEDDELVPFKEPPPDIGDQRRIDILVGMGYNRSDVEESLRTAKFDDAYASYLLLGRRSTDVSFPAFSAVFSPPLRMYFLLNMNIFGMFKGHFFKKKVSCGLSNFIKHTNVVERGIKFFFKGTHCTLQALEKD